MNRQFLTILIIILLGTGVYYYSTLDSAEQQEDIPTKRDNNRTAREDELGIYELSMSFLTNMRTIVDEEGSVVEVLELVNETQVQLDDTIAGLNLIEPQLQMVHSLQDTLNEAKELAETGESPANILDEIRPNKRPS